MLASPALDGELVFDLQPESVLVVHSAQDEIVKFSHAEQNFAAANIPLVPGIPLPPQLSAVKKPLVVGLVAGAAVLTRRATLVLLAVVLPEIMVSV